jgi:glycerophosphoryl diester phosphodiesterase
LAAGGILLLTAAIFLANTNLFTPPADSRPLLIAHRGLGQPFSREGLTGETCTAARMLPASHPYLENTIEGFRAAFAAGADIVEFDVHPTTDGHFVVFHDWTLDCRTEGTGRTRDHGLAELKALDIGYGYTADGGRTFPFRGKGVGLMPTLDEVLAAFPGKRFLINVKSDDAEEGSRLGSRIAALPAPQRRLVMVYGGGAAMAAFAAGAPDVVLRGTDGLKRCLLRYFALGWSGYVPADCRNSLFMLPANFGRWTWAYPYRLAERLKRFNTLLVLLGDYDGSGFSSGVDDLATLHRLPPRFAGAIWTNRIDVIGPALAAQSEAKSPFSADGNALISSPLKP